MKKKLIGLVIILLFISFLSWAIVEGMRLGNTQGYEPKQPIEYSHALHAGENQMQCLYCHFSAEHGRNAGIPPAEVCMNCHKIIKKDAEEVKKIATAIETNTPIEWVRVHKLPDYVYFNHSQHVSVGKIPCQDCHGPVETMKRVRQDMPLTMGWCIDCHRQKGIAPPPPKDGEKDHTTNAGADCAKCHY